MCIKKQIKHLALLPLWCMQLLTPSSSFRRNRVLGNRVLNRMGLHVVRIVLAHAITRLRQLYFQLNPRLSKEHRKAYLQHGFVAIENVLNCTEHAALLKEVQNLDAEVRECVQGDTLTHRVHIHGDTKKQLPVSVALLDKNDINALHRFAAAKNSDPISYVQTIKNGYIEGHADPQKSLHSDTFHPTMKSWYFLNDVSLTQAPFTYVPGSHKLSLKRLRWEYAMSIGAANHTNPYTANGSFRMPTDELEQRGFNTAQPIAVKANTLLIANTHGFHCRGAVDAPCERTEIWSIHRSNPFNPFPGLGFDWVSSWQNSAVQWYRVHCDRKAARLGKESSWHIVKARNTSNTESSTP